MFTFLDDAKGSQVLLDASACRGALLARVAGAEILHKSGDRETSRRIWKGMYDQAEEGRWYNALAHSLPRRVGG
jgi:hypothetical protein